MPEPDEDLNTHIAHLGSAIEKLDAPDATREAFQTAGGAIGALAGRVSGLIAAQGDVLSRLERLELEKAVETEGTAVEDVVTGGAEPPPEVPAEPIAQDDRSILRRFHDAIG
jgi:hypothetical protein